MKQILVSILLLAAGMMSAQDVPTSFPRKFLLEHFTSEQCYNCPSGYEGIEEFVNTPNSPYIWVTHHAGYATDEYTISESEKIAKNLGITFAPAAVINRVRRNGSMGMDARIITNYTIDDDTVAEASVVIAHTYNAATRQLDVTVSGQVANLDAKKYLLSILIKENGLAGKQADDTYSWKGAVWKEYLHARVVRDFVTSHFGDTVLVQDQHYTYTTSFTIAENWVPENCCVVAYLTGTNKKPVINAEQVPLVAGTEGGEQYLPYGITEGKGPNMTIEFDSVEVNKVSDNQLEIVMKGSKTFKTRGNSIICKEVGYVYLNTPYSELAAGTYPIQAGDEVGTVAAGYRMDAEQTLGGSRLVYAVSADLKNGIVTPIHQWRMTSGNMVVDEQGNISLELTTYNGTNITATCSQAVALGVEDVKSSADQTRKVLRNGQLLIKKNGQWYSILGGRL